MKIFKNLIVIVFWGILIGILAPDANATYKPFAYKPYRYDPFEYQYGPNSYPQNTRVFVNKRYVVNDVQSGSNIYTPYKPGSTRYVESAKHYNTNANYNNPNNVYYVNNNYNRGDYTLITPYTDYSNSKFKKTHYGYPGKIPGIFFGNWRVESILRRTDIDGELVKMGEEIWNIYPDHNVIYIKNTLTGTTNHISLQNVKGNYLEFIRSGVYDDKRVTERIRMDIKGDYFAGLDEMRIDTMSQTDGSILKTETATYYLNGERYFEK